MGNKGTLNEAKMDMKDPKNRPETDPNPDPMQIQNPESRPYTNLDLKTEL